MHKVWVGVAFLITAFARDGLGQPGAQPAGGAAITTGQIIDGAVNPELIPEETAWESAFRRMAGELLPDNDLPIPTAIYHVSTPQERAMLRKEALYLKKWYAGMEQQAMKLFLTISDAERMAVMSGTAAPETVAKWNDATRQFDALNEAHRQEILAARDRLLAPGVLSPNCAYALTTYVEHGKKGMKRIPLNAAPKP